MIDIDDLSKLEICNKCKVVFMPKFKLDCGYPPEPFAENTEYCSNCSKKGDQK